MQIAVITDTHFGIKNDAQYMLEYQEKFYKNIFFPYLIKNNIKTIFHLGDLFDRRKYVNYVTLKRTKEMFFDTMREYGMKCYIIPGNHDVYHKNSNDVNSLQQVLGEYSDVVEVIMEPTAKEFDGVDFSFVPWINSSNYEDTMKWLTNKEADSIICGHLEIAGYEMYAGVKNEHGMSPDVFSKFNEVWSGHFHHKSENGNIKYLGAPMEFTFADCDDPRGFHVFNTEKKDLTFIRNTYTMYEKLYYNDEGEKQQLYYRDIDAKQFAGKVIKMYVVRKTAPALFEYFVEKIYEQPDVKMVIHEDYSEFHEENIDLEEVKDQSTKDLMESYVDGVETDMDKDRLKNILNTMYIEALNTGSAGNL